MDLKCKWCGEIKPSDQFILRSRLKPVGQPNVRCCKQCQKDYNAKRYTDPSIRAKQLRANANWRKAHPDKMRLYEKRYFDAEPQRFRARNRVGYLIRTGVWKKQPCVVCGAPAEAHHESYAESHWDLVRWLCKDHHESWHSHFNPTRDAVLTEPLAEVQRLRNEALELQTRITNLRQEFRQKYADANAIELAAWKKVIDAAEPIFQEFVKKH